MNKLNKVDSKLSGADVIRGLVKEGLKKYKTIFEKISKDL